MNVQAAGKSFRLIFDAPIIFHMSCYCGCKEKNDWNDLHIKYRTKSPHI